MATVQITDLSVHLVDRGEGAPVLFLHGLPLDQHMWQAQVAALSGRCRTLVPDLRGFGRTGGAGEKTTLDQMADDVLQLLDALQVTEPVAICGLSMGGYLALLLARKAPQRIRALALCDCRSAADTPEAAANRISMAERLLQDGPRIIAEAMLPKMFASQTNERSPAVVDSVRNVILANSSQGIAAAQRGMAERPDLTESLGQIAVPALLICGAEDQISPSAEMQGLAAAVPGSQYVEISGAGHMAPVEQPAAVNAALVEFLERVQVI